MALMTPEEILKALNTRPRPLIPMAYETAINDSISALEVGLRAIDRIDQQWPTIQPPVEAKSLHESQAAHRDALRSLYKHLLLMKRTFLETGADSRDALQEGAIRSLRVDLAYRDLTRELEKVAPGWQAP
jgi:hypothetical protein